jgi:dimethylaniline monooxygenase (N-oxide forming)
MQATYVCGLISGRFLRPENMRELNALDQQHGAVRFAKLDLEAVYPVEMFDYCDRLARAMNAYPSLGGAGSLRSWWQMQLSPATTAHYYYHDPRIRSFFERAPVYMPRLLILLLLLLKPIDWSFRAMHWLRRSPTTR